MEEPEEGENPQEESAERSEPERASRISLRRRNLSSHTQILYNRNRFAICRALLFGLLVPSPCVALAFVLDLSIFLKISSAVLVVFGLIDLGCFLCYHDRINDMVVFEGQDRRTPRGCPRQQPLSRLLAFFLLGPLGLFAYSAVDMNLHLDYLSLFLLFGLLEFFYLLALLSLRAMKVYYFFISVVFWLVLALLLSLASLFTGALTCCRFVLGRGRNYWKERRVRLVPGQLARLQREYDGDFSCAVCLDDMKASHELLDLPCEDHKHHFFHMKCGRQWIQDHHTCPICRREYAKYAGTKSPWRRIWIYRMKQI